MFFEYLKGSYPIRHYWGEVVAPVANVEKTLYIELYCCYKRRRRVDSCRVDKCHGVVQSGYTVFLLEKTLHFAMCIQKDTP